METALFWFKNDLRLDDNPALVRAAEADALLCVYCVDATFDAISEFGVARVGRHRKAFIGESLHALDADIRARGGRLVIRRGEPETVLAKLAAGLGATRVWTQTEIAPEERSRLEAVSAALPEGCTLHVDAANTLYRATDLPFEWADMPGVFTPFRKQVESSISVREPIDAPAGLPAPPMDRVTVIAPDAIEWPDNETPFPGGESAARNRLAHYFWDTDAIAEYKKTRNGLIGMDYSSKFSPWLAQGSVSARRVAAELARYETRVTANKSTYWLLFELHWREFYHWTLAARGPRLFARSGLLGRSDRPTAADAETLEAWQTGRTGVPFVDANMRELAATGYMSNRGRQNAASFLARDLRQDWRYGAAWFESLLVDYDVASNWGNWATVAGVGTDKRDNGFDVMVQARRYDAEAEYISRWVPELRDLPASQRLAPWEAGDQRGADIDYPRRD